MADIEVKVIEIVADQMGVDKGEVTRETSFVNDLNADSLDTVELVMEFEDEFELSIPDEEAEKIQTVGQAIDHQPGTRVEHPARRSRRDLQVQWALQRRRFRGGRQSDGCQRVWRRPSRCGASDVLARLSAREAAGLRQERLLATGQRARKVGRHRAAVLQHSGVFRGASGEGGREVRRARRD